MKSAPFSKLLTLSFVLGFAVTACQPRRPHITPIPGASTSAPGGDGAGSPIPPGGVTTLPPGATGVGDIPQGSRDDDRFNPDRETFKEQTVYFEFDKSTVRPSEKPKIDQVAAFLQSNPTFHLRIEGHCDERGTEEYNRSLGERRAISIREALVAAGITPERVTTTSFGEDQPAVAGHDEAAWAKNRRGEFVLLRPKS